MSNLILPPSMQMTDKTSIGPVALGDMFPWRGLVFKVSKILGNDHNDFMLVLVPVAPTKGYIKRAQGKKGKRPRTIRNAGKHGVSPNSSLTV